MVEILVWVGALTFAMSGSLLAVRKRLDAVGAVVLGFVTAVGGGSVRDLLAGRIPPEFLSNDQLLWAVVAVSIAGAFVGGRLASSRVLYVFDTFGMAVFAALGALTALDLMLGFWGVVVAGVASGVGGGVIRDVLADEVPVILHEAGDLYATAAATAAIAIWTTQRLDHDIALVISVLAAVATRTLPSVMGMRIPRPRGWVGKRT